MNKEKEIETVTLMMRRYCWGVHGTRGEFVDIAGLVKGASQGAGLGNKFLGHIRECDAIVHVVRCFDMECCFTGACTLCRAL